MSEETSFEEQVITDTRNNSGNYVAIAAILTCGLIVMCTIMACCVTLIAFFSNPPWYIY
jgi:hypothetical protein